MAGITNYSQNQFQYFYKRVAKASGASGTEVISWAASGASGMSGISSTSYVSGASGFTVEGLTTNEIVELFSKGNLTVGEMQKWLKVKGATFTFSETSQTVSFKFKLDDKDYEVRCTKAAAASQTDNIVQNMLYSQSLVKNLGLNDAQLEIFFKVAKSANGYISYMINPETGLNSIKEIKEAIKNKCPADVSFVATCITLHDKGYSPVEPVIISTDNKGVLIRFQNDKNQYKTIYIEGSDASTYLDIGVDVFREPCSREELIELVPNYDKLDDESKANVDNLIEKAIDKRWTQEQFETRLEKLDLQEQQASGDSEKVDGKQKDEVILKAANKFRECVKNYYKLNDDSKQKVEDLIKDAIENNWTQNEFSEMVNSLELVEIITRTETTTSTLQNGNIGELIETLDSEGNVIGVTITITDKTGKKISEEEYTTKAVVGQTSSIYVTKRNDGSVRYITDTIKDANGNIVRIIETYYHENGTVDYVTDIINDENGNIVKKIETYYHENGTVDNITDTIKDENGNTVKKFKTCYDEAGNANSTVEWTYINGKETAVKVISKYSNGEEKTFEYKTQAGENQTGNIYVNNRNDGSIYHITDIIQDENKNTVKKIETYYDENGNITSIYEYFNNTAARTLFEYDNDGNMIKKSKSIYDQSSGSRTIECYDNNFNITESTTYDKYGDLYKKRIYEYDSNTGKLKSMYETTYYSSNIGHSREIIYDPETGCAIKKIYADYDEDGKIIDKYEHTINQDTNRPTWTTITYYDKNGNVTKKVEKQREPEIIKSIEYIENGTICTIKDELAQFVYEHGDSGSISQSLLADLVTILEDLKKQNIIKDYTIENGKIEFTINGKTFTYDIIE